MLILKITLWWYALAGILDRWGCTTERIPCPDRFTPGPSQNDPTPGANPCAHPTIMPPSGARAMSSRRLPSDARDVLYQRPGPCLATWQLTGTLPPMGKKRTESVPLPAVIDGSSYDDVLEGISELLDRARRAAARAVNPVLAATSWEVGRRVVEFEQRGRARAEYGEGLVKRLSAGLTARHGRGFSRRNIEHMRAFYQGWKIGRHRLPISRRGSGAPSLRGPPATREHMASFMRGNPARSDSLPQGSTSPVISGPPPRY